LQVVGKGGSAGTLGFANIPGVEIIGEVERPCDWVSQALLTIVPLKHGTGSRIKIAESLACGRPVVATSIGAEGFELVRPDQGLILTDQPAAMADAIETLVRSPQQAREIGVAGRRLAERLFSWETITASLADDVERWVHAARSDISASLVRFSGEPQPS